MPIIATTVRAWGCLGCDLLLDNWEGLLGQAAVYCCPVHHRHLVIVTIREREDGLSVAFLSAGGAIGPDPT